MELLKSIFNFSNFILTFKHFGYCAYSLNGQCDFNESHFNESRYLVVVVGGRRSDTTCLDIV